MQSPKPPKQTTIRLQSPIGPFFLGSNDDQLERARARAARAASVRRKTAPSPPTPPADPCLERQQIIELLNNCIRLATENKINQKNTWDLKLIDHLSEIIKVEAGNDAETNFQKASCTLEAGVKIYSLRVDSVHSEAYKVLGRITRAAGDDQQENVVEGDDTGNGPNEGCVKKETERKISPLSTLESSFEALNAKKIDVAFAVDPLYHQTSAQFDEGGTRGLLLNNLGLYGECRVLFDSLEVPRMCMSRSLPTSNLDIIDISFLRENVEQMVMNMPGTTEISPTLGDIVCQFGEGRADSVGDNNFQLDGNSFGNFAAGNFYHEEEISVVDDSFGLGEMTFPSHHEEDDPCTSYEADKASEEIAVFLFKESGFTTKLNAWAGPDHWKYRKPKGSEDASANESRSDIITKRSKNNKHDECDIDFSKALDQKMFDIFAPPKNSKKLLLPANRLPSDSKLPEDCHYQPEDLVKLFLLPDVMCFSKRRSKLSDNNSWQQNSNFDEQLPPGDNESAFGGQYDDGYFHSAEKESADLVSQPRQVCKTEVQYDRGSKQVDVHVLKETLWDHIQESIQGPEMDTFSFKLVLSTFPDDCRAAAPEDISTHLCFICLLHLANEHNLSIYDCPTLDDLSIRLPSCGNA